MAGAIVAGGVWLLLQLLFTGAALSAVDPTEVDHVKTFAVGATVSSLLPPIIAMFIGGMLAGRLASQYDRKITGLHGVMVWAITAVVGLAGTAMAVSALVSRPVAGPHADMMAVNAPAPGTSEYLDTHVEAVSTALETQGAPAISKDDVIAAARTSVRADGTLDREMFIANLDEQTKLSRPEAEAAVNAMGASTPDVIVGAHQVAKHREQALEVADAAGKSMLAAGLALVLSLLASILGATVGRRIVRRPLARDTVRDTAVGHTTAQYDAVTP